MNTAMLWSMSVATLAIATLATNTLRAQTAATDSGQASYLSAGCHHCHGLVGQGARGPTMVGLQYPYEAFEIFVRQPVSGGMPPYSAQMLPEAELRSIFAYLASLPGPAEERPALLK